MLYICQADTSLQIMNVRRRWYIVIPIVLIIGFLAWYFSTILIYILVATVLSLTGRPLVRLLDKIRIKKFHFPHTLSAVITLLVIFGAVAGLFAVVVPLLITQATELSNIDTQVLIDAYRPQLDQMKDFLLKYQMIQPDQDIETLISEKVSSVVGKTNITDIMGSLIDVLGNLFVAVFAIGFITFFFLKNERMLLNAIMLMTPVGIQTEIKHVYIKTIRLLSRYFTGLLLDLTIVITLITIGLWAFGFENALMIGIFAGVMNVVPYIGPLIGAGIALVLGLTGNMEPGVYQEIFPLTMQILGVLIVINLLDAFVIQPTIYSNRVKAHPLEIFLVILISGSAAGILGMVLAIPTYTVLRIIAKEFLSKWRFVRKITEKI
jgi:predicted PurR-regulated permease PerM